MIEKIQLGPYTENEIREGTDNGTQIGPDIFRIAATGWRNIAQLKKWARSRRLKIKRSVVIADTEGRLQIYREL